MSIFNSKKEKSDINNCIDKELIVLVEFTGVYCLKSTYYPEFMIRQIQIFTRKSKLDFTKFLITSDENEEELEDEFEDLPEPFLEDLVNDNENKDLLEDENNLEQD